MSVVSSFKKKFINIVIYQVPSGKTTLSEWPLVNLLFVPHFYFVLSSTYIVLVVCTIFSNILAFLNCSLPNAFSDFNTKNKFCSCLILIPLLRMAIARRLVGQSIIIVVVDIASILLLSHHVSHLFKKLFLYILP